MNRLAIAVKALTFVMLLSVVACSGSDEKANSAADSLQSNAKQAEAFTVSTNIRYIDLDSVMANYNLAVEISCGAYPRSRKIYPKLSTFSGIVLYRRCRRRAYLGQRGIHKRDRRDGRLLSLSKRVLRLFAWGALRDGDGLSEEGDK